MPLNKATNQTNQPTNQPTKEKEKSEFKHGNYIQLSILKRLHKGMHIWS